MIRVKGRLWVLMLVANLTLFWSATGVARAQEQEVAAAGKAPYGQYCATCHGRDAKGDGPAMNLLTVKPADLTQISKRNNGTFPFWKIYRVVDGREEIKGHGRRDMPLWGAAFRTEVGSSMTAQSQVRGRIIALVFYLQSIQAE